jgi:predicted RNase H-like HicB family nuclease
MKIAVHVRQAQDSKVVAWCPDLPGCTATGASADEALERLKRSVSDWFEGDRRPLPPGTRRIAIDV